MRTLILLTLALSLGTVQGFAQDKFKHEQKIESLVEPYLTHKKVNSVSIGVIADGLTWKRSFGSLTTDDTRSADEKTLYEIGSISKVFTSILLAEAIESGKLKLDDPISTVMPDLAKKIRRSETPSRFGICHITCLACPQFRPTLHRLIRRIRSRGTIVRC